MCSRLVALPSRVRRGLYATHLGGAAMAALPPSVEPSAGTKLYLRIWFDGGTGTFQPLSPVVEFGAVPLALHTRSVTEGGVDSTALADGAVTSAKIAEGAVSLLGTPDGTTTDVVRVTGESTVGVGTAAPEAGLQVAAGSQLLIAQNLSTLVDGRSGFDALSGVVDVASSGDLIAIASRQENSVTLIDIADPSMPVLRSVITDGTGGFDHLGGAFAVSFSGNQLAIGAIDDDSVTIVDADDPANPVLGNVFTDGSGGFDKLDGVSDVEFTPGGQLVIASEFDDVVTVVNDPTGSPTILVTLADGQFGFNDLDGARAIAFSGGLMAVAAIGDDSVSLIDMSTPANPVLKAVMKDGGGSFTELDGAAAVAFNGDLLAIGGGGGWLGDPSGYEYAAGADLIGNSQRRGRRIRLPGRHKIGRVQWRSAGRRFAT